MNKILKFFDHTGAIVIISIPAMIGMLIGMLIAKRFISWISANPDKIPNVIIGGFVFIIVSCILGKITKKIGNKHKKNNVEHKDE